MVPDAPAPVAAGADIKEMSKLTFADAYGQDKFNEWARLGKIRKPVRNAGCFFIDTEKYFLFAVVLDRDFSFRVLLCVTCSCLVWLHLSDFPGGGKQTPASVHQVDGCAVWCGTPSPLS